MSRGPFACACTGTAHHETIASAAKMPTVRFIRDFSCVVYVRFGPLRVTEPIPLCEATGNAHDVLAGSATETSIILRHTPATVQETSIRLPHRSMRQRRSAILTITPETR